MFGQRYWGWGNTTVWQTSLAGRHRVEEIHAEHSDYRITLEQVSPLFEPPLVGDSGCHHHRVEPD